MTTRKPKLEWGYIINSLRDNSSLCKIQYKNGTRSQLIELLVSDFKRLDPNVYLNDTLILFYLK